MLVVHRAPISDGVWMYWSGSLLAHATSQQNTTQVCTPLTTTSKTLRGLALTCYKVVDCKGKRGHGQQDLNAEQPAGRWHDSTCSTRVELV